MFFAVFGCAELSTKPECASKGREMSWQFQGFFTYLLVTQVGCDKCVLLSHSLIHLTNICCLFIYEQNSLEADLNSLVLSLSN